MTRPTDAGALPTWFKLVLVLAGVILMLTGAGLIPADPSRLRAPHWVLSVAGLAFFSAGIVTFLARHRDTNPARYLFAVGILMTCLFAVCVAASIYASGTAVAIGPLLIKGAVADKISRAGYVFGALVMGVLALVVWRSWYRTMKSSASRQGARAEDRPAAEHEC